MTANTEAYKKYVQKVDTLQKQRKRRSLPTTKALEDFWGNFAHIAMSLELTQATKAHVIGLSASMENLKASESALGLFSDPFIDIAERLAEEIVKLTKKNAPQGTTKIVQWWLEMTVLVVVGVIELAKEKTLSKEEAIFDVPFRDELLLTLLFYTGYPKFVFKQMAEGLEIPEAKQNIFIGLFEGLALTFALLANSSEEEIRSDLAEAVSGLLKKTIRDLKQGLENRELEAYLELAEMALEKGEIDQLTLTLHDLMNSAGYPKELLFKDISAMKALFKRLKIAYLSAHAKTTNMIHMIG